MKGSLADYIKYLGSKNIYHSPSSLIWYFNNYIFKNINLKNKIILDIGGGIGLISFYAIFKGANKSILIEPESAGAGSFKMQNFHLLKSELNLDETNILHVNNLFQNLKMEPNSIDIIVLHNSINHLDESACINLLTDPTAQKKYVEIFSKIHNILKKGGSLILLDCSSKNFFNDLNIKNPIAPSIEWHKHQRPEVWVKIMKETGFNNFKIKWSSLKQLRQIGRILFGNKLAAYFTYSHFLIKSEKG